MTKLEKLDYALIRSRLRSMRTFYGQTVSQVAGDTGIGAQYLSELESTRQPSPWQHLVAIASVYGTTTDYLLGVSWAKSRQRDVFGEWSEEAMRVAQFIESLPDQASRQAWLETVQKLADTISEKEKHKS